MTCPLDLQNYFSLIIPPEKLTDKNPQIEISTIDRSRGRMGRVDSGDVKNSVLPRWRSAAINAPLLSLPQCLLFFVCYNKKI